MRFSKFLVATSWLVILASSYVSGFNSQTQAELIASARARFQMILPHLQCDRRSTIIRVGRTCR
jgi:hypothetical protein